MGIGSWASIRAPILMAIGEPSVGRGRDLRSRGTLSGEGLSAAVDIDGTSKRKHSSASSDQVTATKLTELGTSRR